MGVFRQLLDKSVDLLEVVQSQLVERAETAVFIGQRVRLHPSAAGILIEILLGVGFRIEVFSFDADATL